ncbi:membrane protein, PF01595 family [Bacteriovorax sp. BAL6_X]|uniref:CNNM domain-containing protein n=1 Tax=Bacteriovorax sp. BAL6_X TaxID=1201290 RepID=UPI000386768F|nr:CNNM domain-containing protein [Bacteriovorax sp. BAL6_X]EPZ49649.1 membrane protein, PF01595 family [Bacteriovorax sp. BAL6_X]
MLIIYIVISIGVSFLCSIMEAVLLSITPSFILASQRQNRSYAQALKKYASNKDESISAILTLNTFAHTLGAAGVGSEAIQIFKEMGVSGVNLEYYLSAVSIVLTLAILYLSEIIPKSLGHHYWKSLTPYLLRILPPLIFILRPILFISMTLMRLLKTETEHKMSREEVESMIELGVQTKALAKDEGEFLKESLLASRKVIEEVMTPARKVFMVHVEDTIASVYDLKAPVTRIPCYGENVNEISGYIHKEDIAKSIIENNKDKKLYELQIIRPIAIINRQTPLRNLFKRFIRENEHIAMVSDDYGTILGVITLEDIVETFFGIEIMDEFDEVEDLQGQAKDEILAEEKKREHL